MTTWAPIFASLLDTSKPIPLPPPVTMATRPDRSVPSSGEKLWKWGQDEQSNLLLQLILVPLPNIKYIIRTWTQLSDAYLMVALLGLCLSQDNAIWASWKSPLQDQIHVSARSHRSTASCLCKQKSRIRVFFLSWPSPDPGASLVLYSTCCCRCHSLNQASFRKPAQRTVGIQADVRPQTRVKQIQDLPSISKVSPALPKLLASTCCEPVGPVQAVNVQTMTVSDKEDESRMSHQEQASVRTALMT